MHYRVFSGPRGSEDISSITKRNMLYKEFDALDSALSWARHIEREGRTPLLTTAPVWTAVRSAMPCAWASANRSPADTSSRPYSALRAPFSERWRFETGYVRKWNSKGRNTAPEAGFLHLEAGKGPPNGAFLGSAGCGFKNLRIDFLSI